MKKLIILSSYTLLQDYYVIDNNGEIVLNGKVDLSKEDKFDEFILEMKQKGVTQYQNARPLSPVLMNKVEENFQIIK